VVIRVGTQNTYGCWSNELWGLGNDYTCDTFLRNLVAGLDTTGTGNANDVENAFLDPDGIGCELDNLADRLPIGFTNNITETMKLNLDTILIYWKPISSGGTGSPSLKVEVSANGSTWVNAATYTRNNTAFVTDTLKNPVAGARYVRLSVTANVARKPLIDAVEFRQYRCNSIQPVAENGVFSILEDQSARIPVLSLVSSARGLPDSVRRISNGPYNGYASINPDQSISYTPFNDFDGKDSFTYTVVNTRGMQSSGKVVINVQADLCSSGQRGGSYKDTTIAVTVGSDAYLRQEKATTNYGNENRLKMGWGDRDTKEYRSVLYFNLNSGGAAIPTSAIVLDSRLELYRNGGKDNVTVNLHKINGTGLFAETQVNWTRRLNATNWTTAGGDYAATVYGSLNTGSGGSANNAWHYSSQLNTLVQDWISTPSNNLGMLAKRSGSYLKSSLAQFESDDAARKPILRVRYSSVVGCQAIPNQKPLIVADYDTVTFPASVSRNVVSNDRDPQGTTLNLTASAPVYKVYGGTATRSGNVITFTPSRGFVGTGYVEYRVTDGSLTDTGWYFIT
ncbi:MAG: DNRLRE domain-containing protein, partial [Bacteroidetes bacterium]|nr:DNRLRE domain-containing protein [Bacteroidota bacterium]